MQRLQMKYYGFGFCKIDEADLTSSPLFIKMSSVLLHRMGKLTHIYLLEIKLIWEGGRFFLLSISRLIND